MGNQQPKPLVMLARNAKLGDGNIWKHPRCVNAKLVFTSTTPELLEAKRAVCPEMFPAGVREIKINKPENRFPNAKPIFSLASVVSPTFTEYRSKSKIDVFLEMTLADVALWYLDDGSCVRRRDAEGFRVYLSVGNLCPTLELESRVSCKLAELFGGHFGSIQKNNSKATENNKSIILSKRAAGVIFELARVYGIMMHKLPREWFND